MEPRRRQDLVLAAIAEIAAAGTLDVTVARIAKRAGMSSALAHHYFGSKDKMMLAAMRHVLTDFGRQARAELAKAATPQARLEAIVRVSFDQANFRDEIVAAWLNFYLQAQRVGEARRLLHVYHARLRSNLVDALRSLVADPDAVAEGVGALIDGLYVRQALRRECLSSEASGRLVLDYVARSGGR